MQKLVQIFGWLTVSVILLVTAVLSHPFISESKELTGAAFKILIGIFIIAVGTAAALALTMILVATY